MLETILYVACLVAFMGGLYMIVGIVFNAIVDTLKPKDGTKLEVWLVFWAVCFMMLLAAIFMMPAFMGMYPF